MVLEPSNAAGFVHCEERQAKMTGWLYQDEQLNCSYLVNVIPKKAKDENNGKIQTG